MAGTRARPAGGATGARYTEAALNLRDDFDVSITIYGIKNCDTMKKARAWLDDHGVAYDFHDYKAVGIAKDKLKRWSDEVGWETLLNRAGTTFRNCRTATRKA